MVHTFVLILHVFGAGILVGVVWLSIMSVIRPAVIAQQIDRLGFVHRFGIIFSGWQFVTGVVLFLMERDELQGNHLLWAKLGLYVIEGAFAGMVLDRRIKALRADATNALPTSTLRTLLVIHAALIVAIVSLGVMIVEQ